MHKTLREMIYGSQNFLFMHSGSKKEFSFLHSRKAFLRNTGSLELSVRKVLSILAWVEGQNQLYSTTGIYVKYFFEHHSPKLLDRVWFQSISTNPALVKIVSKGHLLEPPVTFPGYIHISVSSYKWFSHDP